MAKLIVRVDNDAVESLKVVLQNISYVREVVIEEIALNDSINRYEKIKTILNNARGKKLFADIKDPVEWQRNIRGE